MNNNILGSSGYVGMTGTQGVYGVTGTTGSQGTGSPAGTTIQMVQSILDKWGMRFTLNDYRIDNGTMLPQFIITDNFTLKEHQFTTISMINLPQHFESFINNIIITDRDNKIQTIING